MKPLDLMVFVAMIAAAIVSLQRDLLWCAAAFAIMAAALAYITVLDYLNGDNRSQR